MKTPSVFLIGVCVLLLSGLIVCTVLSFSPWTPPVRTLLQLVVFIPYFISTYLVMSVHRGTKTGHCSVLVTIMSIIGSGESEGVIVLLRRTFGCHPDYKSLSVPVIIGGSVLLSGVTVCTVFSLSPPSPPIMTLLRLVAFIPYFISTYLVMSVHRSMKTGLPPVVSMNMQPDVEGGQRCDEDFDDLTNVTTEHDF